MNKLKIGQILYYPQVVWHSYIAPDYYDIIELKVKSISYIEKHENNVISNIIKFSLENNNIFNNNVEFDINDKRFFKTIEELKEEMKNEYGFI